jgi:hypothetical protein
VITEEKKTKNTHNNAILFFKAKFRINRSIIASLNTFLFYLVISHNYHFFPAFIDVGHIIFKVATGLAFDRTGG